MFVGLVTLSVIIIAFVLLFIIIVIVVDDILFDSKRKKKKKWHKAEAVRSIQRQLEQKGCLQPRKIFITKWGVKGILRD